MLGNDLVKRATVTLTKLYLRDRYNKEIPATSKKKKGKVASNKGKTKSLAVKTKKAVFLLRDYT